MECFTVYADEIEGRLDPLYLRNKKIIETPSTKYKLVEMGSILKNKVQYGANETAIEGNPNVDVRYIRITDIDEYGNLKSDDWKTAKRIDNKYLLNENDVLFARSGATAGKCLIYKTEYRKSIFAGYLIRFVFDISKVNPRYIFYYTQLKRYQLWVKSIQRPSGQPNINSEEYKSLKIPIPPFETQNRIVQLMDRAYSLKKSHEAEAQRLLDSINDYVIQELNSDFNKKGKSIFCVESNKIINRLDPLYYSIDVYYFLEKSKYPLATIGEVSLTLKTGFAAGRNDQDLEEEGTIQIRPTNISKTRQLIFDKCIYIKAEEKESLVQRGEILFNNTNSQELVGKSTYFDIEGSYFCSNHITRINVDTNRVNPFYLTQLLNTYQSNNLFFRICTNWNNQSGVNIDLLKTVKIPLPSLPIQNRIAEEVKNRIQKAKQLQKEAKEELEKAKQEVERIILGEGAVA